MGFAFRDAPPAGLHVRNSVSVATDGADADSTVSMSYADLTAVLSGQARLKDLLVAGRAAISGDAAATLAALAVFEIVGLRD